MASTTKEPNAVKGRKVTPVLVDNPQNGGVVIAPFFIRHIMPKMSNRKTEEL